MKKIVVGVLSLYQILVSPLIHAATGTTHACRYSPTCSEYAKQQILEKGVLKGGLLAIKRVLSCHPFAKVASYQV